MWFCARLSSKFYYQWNIQRSSETIQQAFNRVTTIALLSRRITMKRSLSCSCILVNRPPRRRCENPLLIIVSPSLSHMVGWGIWLGAGGRRCWTIVGLACSRSFTRKWFTQTIQQVFLRYHNRFFETSFLATHHGLQLYWVSEFSFSLWWNNSLWMKWFLHYSYYDYCCHIITLLLNQSIMHRIRQAN